MSIGTSRQQNAVMAGFVLTAAFAAAQTTSYRPIVSHPLQFAISHPLSQSPPAPRSTGQTVIPLQPIPRPSSTPVKDPVIQTTAGPLIAASSGVQFDGIGADGYEPSDANLAVGQNHIVHIVNVI